MGAAWGRRRRLSQMGAYFTVKIFPNTDPDPIRHTRPLTHLSPRRRATNGSHTLPPPGPAVPLGRARARPLLHVCTASLFLNHDRPVDPRGLADGGGHGDPLSPLDVVDVVVSTHVSHTRKSCRRLDRHTFLCLVGPRKGPIKRGRARGVPIHAEHVAPPPSEIDGGSELRLRAHHGGDARRDRRC
jgi:hypothetical protein